jgi:NDP-sugar pyrophosphorylase family protein
MKIDVFILAAGESSRMFPLNSIMEKSLLPVDGKPVIRHIVENLTVPEVARHLRKITICCLEKFKKQFEHEFRDMPSIEILPYDSPSGTFTTFMCAHPRDFVGITQWGMVHYADCMTDIDYIDFIKNIDPKYDGLLAVTRNVKHDYSEVLLGDEVSMLLEKTKIMAFFEKPLIGHYTWSGIGIFKTKALGEYFTSPLKNQDFAYDIFPKMIEKNRLVAYPYSGYWYDCGNLNSYRKLCDLFKEK